MDHVRENCAGKTVLSDFLDCCSDCCSAAIFCVLRAESAQQSAQAASGVGTLMSALCPLSLNLVAHASGPITHRC